MCGLAGFLQPAGFGESTGRKSSRTWRECSRTVDPTMPARGWMALPASRWAIGVSPSSTCRRPGISRCIRRRAASSSSSTAKSTIISQLRAEAGRFQRVVARSFRHGDAACRHRALGDRGHAQQERRHVRVRVVGPTRARIERGARSDGREASVLRLAGWRLSSSHRSSSLCACIPRCVRRSIAER